MKRILLLLTALFSFAAVSAPVHAAVNDFTISNYDIQYELSRDEEQRSRLTTTETITAVFPNTDQNHGLERAIPQSYDGHPTSLKVTSVTDGSGKKLNYETRESSDNLVLRIGDADTYVHGAQTYVIRYEQRDVTRYFADSGQDEFYWDANGTEWAVPIRNLSVSLSVADDIMNAFTGERACYQGLTGSDQRCDVTQNQSVFNASASNLQAGENLTLALGFTKGTFTLYKMSVWEILFVVYMASVVAGVVIGIGLIAWLIVRVTRQTNRTRELGTIVPEYTAPRDVSLTAAASLQTNTGSLFTAQLLDFAVRHYLKVYQTREKSLFKSDEYEIEIVKDISSLKAEEQELLTDIFEGKTAVGTRLPLKSLKNNTKVYRNIQDNDKKLQKLVRGDYGLREKRPEQTAWFTKFAKILLALGIVLLNPAFLIVALIAYICGRTLWPLTDKGLEMYRYMEGLKMYIKVAEVERLKMLQSPEGAAKVGPVNPEDKGSLVKLYEGVLPFAVLFGQEKEWSKHIGELYESSGGRPDWYGSNGAFSALAFSSAMGSFSTAASYSAASSSSSGGAGGGGSSGGGGGGGGGGGW